LPAVSAATVVAVQAVTASAAVSAPQTPAIAAVAMVAAPSGEGLGSLGAKVPAHVAALAPNATDAAAADVATVSRAGQRTGLGGADSPFAATMAQAEAKQAADAQAAVLAAEAKAEADRAHSWVKPLDDYNVSSGYGMRHGKLHPAVDLAGPIGTPVKAMSSGVVISAGWSDLGYGNLVEIQYWDGTVSWYAHNTSLAVSVGDKVTPGMVVSYRGSTGHSTGPHVHLEIHPGGGTAVPPIPWLAAHGIKI